MMSVGDTFTIDFQQNFPDDTYAKAFLAEASKMRLIALGITVKPSKQEIHPEICNEDAQEGEDAEDMEMLRISEPFQRSLVDTEGIDEHCNQRPDLFRIPSPVSSPRNVCPYCADEDSRRQKKQSRIQHDVADGLEIFHPVAVPADQ